MTFPYSCTFTLSGPGDYSAINRSELILNFMPGLTGEVMCFNVSINDDSLVEGSEVFTVMMTEDDYYYSSPEFVLGIDSANVTIMDNDGKFYQIHK